MSGVSEQQLQELYDKSEKYKEYQRGYAKAYDELLPHIQHIYSVLNQHEAALLSLQNQINAMSGNK